MSKKDYFPQSAIACCRGFKGLMNITSDYALLLHTALKANCQLPFFLATPFLYSKSGIHCNSAWRLKLKFPRCSRYIFYILSDVC